MKTLLTLFVCISTNCFGQKQKAVVTSDIATFWNAYDTIVKTKDSLNQIELIKILYLQQGTPGLEAMVRARRYTPEEYIHSINNCPEFWKSIRGNTLKAGYYAEKIEKAIDKLRALYPKLKPATIYFTVGVLRSNGTTISDKVLIGSEIAMADRNTNSSELDTNYPHLNAYFKSGPINNLEFLNVHEYIHTQQSTTIGNSLLAQTVIEGAAEFIAEKALEVESPNPQIQFGTKNNEKLKVAFLKEMFSANFRNWLWNTAENEFGMRDLGYYIGYAICENYYNQANDKKQAINEMIQLEYNNETGLFHFVDQSLYFDKSLRLLAAEFDELRPQIISIAQFENNSRNVDSKVKQITLNFSKPMNVNFRGFDFGPLGEKNVLRVQKIIGFSEDRKSFSFEVTLEKGRQYQCIVTDRFADEHNYPLKPYLIDFKTSN